MTVEELINCLENYPKDLEVLIDCRILDDISFWVQDDYYLDGEAVLHMDI